MKSNKKTVIRRLVNVRQKTLSLIEPLSGQKWNEIFLGKWAISDLIAHFIGWDIWGLKATREILQGKLPSYYEYYEEHWTKINDKLVKEYKRGNKKDSLSTVKKSHKQLIEELENISEKLFNKDFNIRFRGENITISSDTLYQAEDEEDHLKQIQNWLKTGNIQ